MTLTNLTQMPPDGYTYYEPTIKFRTTKQMALQGLDVVARALQRARAQNPAQGLDPSIEACVQAVKDYTCARFIGRPALLAFYCGPLPDASAPLDVAKLVKGKRNKGCAGCGDKR